MSREIESFLDFMYDYWPDMSNEFREWIPEYEKQKNSISQAPIESRDVGDNERKKSIEVYRYMCSECGSGYDYVTRGCPNGCP